MCVCVLFVGVDYDYNIYIKVDIVTGLSIVQVALCSGYYGIYPNAGRRIRGRLQIVATLLCLHNERAVRPPALRGIQMIQIYLVNGLQRSQICLTMEIHYDCLHNLRQSRRHHVASVLTYPNSR